MREGRRERCRGRESECEITTYDARHDPGQKIPHILVSRVVVKVESIAFPKPVNCKNTQ